MFFELSPAQAPELEQGSFEETEDQRLRQAASRFSQLAVDTIAELHKHYHRDAKSLGALANELLVVFALIACEPDAEECTVSEIGRAVGADRKVVRRALERLVEQRLVTKHGAPGDVEYGWRVGEPQRGQDYFDWDRVLTLLLEAADDIRAILRR